MRVLGLPVAGHDVALLCADHELGGPCLRVVLQAASQAHCSDIRSNSCVSVNGANPCQGKLTASITGDMSCLRRSTDDKDHMHAVSELDSKGLSCVVMCLLLLRRHVDSLLLYVCSCSTSSEHGWSACAAQAGAHKLNIALYRTFPMSSKSFRFTETAMLAAFAGCSVLCEVSSHCIDCMLNNGMLYACSSTLLLPACFFLNIETLLCCAGLCCAMLCCPAMRYSMLSYTQGLCKNF